MRSSKHGLKVLVLAMMSVLDTMAFAAVGAQAQLGPHGLPVAHETALNPTPLSKPSETSKAGTFLVNLALATLANIKGEGALGSLLVPTRDLKLECHTAHVEAAKIDSSTDALGKVTFLTCLVLSLSTGKELPCILTTLGSITATALALPILHNEKPFVLFEPQTGTEFTKVSFKEKTECPLPLNNPVTGSVSALVDALDAIKQLLLFSPGIQLLTGDKLSFGLNPAYIDADATLFLLAPNEGQKLGIH